MRKARDELIKQILEFKEYWQEYGSKSYRIDKSKKAKKVFDLNKSSLKDLDKWLRNPNLYDIKGIDTPDKPKRKKTKKNKKPKEVKEFINKVNWSEFCKIISTSGEPSKAKAHIILLNKYGIRLSKNPELWDVIKKKCSANKRKQKKKH
ncbi:hypothetical protein [Thermococcus sp. MV5]|uniref:hypothetical protein n=1 Tax=Thermococcus sp. MV5 TaxID=1638272 RepID=UPI001981FD7E|nr:hypothetical protein [Thermococcus sp. MV5]